MLFSSRTGAAERSASVSASPSAVPSPGRASRVRPRTTLRSCVGGATTAARSAKITTPTRSESGTTFQEALDRVPAAASLVGLTSVAVIERDMSTASMTVASFRLTERVACGRANPVTSTATATSSTATGRCRSRPGDWPTTLGKIAARRTAPCRRAASPLQQDVGRPLPRDEQQREQRERPLEAHRRGLPAAQEGHEQAQPVALGRQHDVPDADGGEQRRATPLRSSAAAAAKRCAQPLAARVDAQPPAGLRVDEPELADVGSSCSRASRISIASTSWRAASCSSGRRQSSGPRKSETTTTSARWRARRAVRAQRRAERGRARPPSLGSSRSAPSSPSSPRRPWRGGRTRGLARRTSTTPSRLPRRVATWPSASATPSATSALRRSAVPNVIEARRVEHEPGRQHPLGDVHAHVRLAACGPSRSSRSGARRRRARTGAPGRARCRRRARRAVVAREQALDAAPDRQVERAQQRAGQRPGPGRAGVARPARRARRTSRAPARRPRSICGIGTVASTWSRIVSGVTSSASAW